jgi:hypothetical protein
MAHIRTIPGLLLAALLVPAFGVFVVMALGMNPFSKTEYAYCVTTDTQSAFTGQWLKNDGRVKAAIELTSTCESLDAARDQNDGPKRGFVRWVVCPKGPDCDEAGNF